MPEIKCLDHGFVRLVDSMGNDLSISRAARVSYNSAPREGDEKLIHYLWRNAHTTPFEAVTFTFEVKAPIFVFRQWHRHRTWSFNELSTRYKELPCEYYTPSLAVIGAPATNNKQGRDLAAPYDGEKYDDAIALYHDSLDLSYTTYLDLLAAGWPRELARAVLPVCFYSDMFATVNLLNLLRFLTLRCSPHAQYEIRVYANAMRDLARGIAPVALSAWELKS